MKPCNFPEANKQQKNADGSNAFTYLERVEVYEHLSGKSVTVAFKPTKAELKAINEGKPIYLTMYNGSVAFDIGTTDKQINKQRKENKEAQKKEATLKRMEKKAQAKKKGGK